MEKINDFIEKYNNTEVDNDNLYDYFSDQTNEINFLKTHRDYIEKNNLGFGERAFHSMWYLIIQYLIDEFKTPNILEIGVYKGQVISLWALIAKELNTKITITGITPLKGNSISKNKSLIRLLSKFSKKIKENLASGNYYDNEDYLKTIYSLFNKFELKKDSLNLIKGYSNDIEVLSQMKNEKFNAIYIDGDHTFEGATNDIINYAGLITKNGLLIMDDASCNIPSTKFWKGHQSVSDACEMISDLGFKNILNVGHNRIFKKLK